MAQRRDHYAALGVSRTASPEDIRHAFRRLALEFHPDVNANDTAAEGRFKRVAAAYATLGDPGKRRRYDLRTGSGLGRMSMGPSSFEMGGGPTYHSDLGRDSDFYRAGDPLTVTQAAQILDRSAGWIRRAIREGRLPATAGGSGYLIRRRDAERFDRSVARRRRPVPDPPVMGDRGPL